jgi:hypothetical protein
MRPLASAVLLLAGLTLGGCAIGGPRPQLDVNAADSVALATIPGIAPEDADRIVANRPYMSKEDLLRRRILTEGQYASVAAHLFVGPPGMPDYLLGAPPQAEGP